MNATDDPVINACQSNDIEALRVLLDEGLDPNRQDMWHRRPLDRAMQYDCLEMARLLLERGADPNGRGVAGATPLMSAQSAAAARLLVDAGAAPNAATAADHGWSALPGGTTPLLAAAGAGRQDVVEVLLAAGADLAARDNRGRNAVMLAALGGHMGIVEQLGRAGAEAGLVEAAALCDAERLTALLSAEPRPDQAQIDRALWWAAERGCSPAIQLLLDAGADVNSANSNGVPAILRASVGGHVEAMRLLLERGASVETDADRVGTPLLAYLTSGQERAVEGVRLLLNHGADPNLHGRNALIPGWSPLMLASIHGDVAAAKLLLQRGAGPNLWSDEAGAEEEGVGPSNALEVAATNGHVDVVRLLLQHGADPLAAGSDGTSAWTAVLQRMDRPDKREEREQILDLFRRARRRGPDGEPIRLELRHRDTREVLATVEAPLAYAEMAGLSLPGVDLTNASLLATNLSGADLTKADLSHSHLASTNLSGAKLHKAKMEHSDLHQANLSNADLTEARIRRSEVFCCRLEGADLRGVGLSSVTLSFADLSGKDLSGARWSTARFRRCSFAGCRMSSGHLWGLLFEECEFTGAVLAGTQFRGVLFRDVDFEGADFTGAVLQNAAFVTCRNLRRAVGLETVEMKAYSRTQGGGPSSLDVATLRDCRAALPDAFLRGFGYSDEEIAAWRAMYGCGGTE